MLCKNLIKISGETLLRSYLWHLEITVIGIFWISVVANINFVCSGGSSSVFNNALNALFDSMCTSSIINTLYRADAGLYLTLSIISLMSPTPVLLAASISRTST